MEPRHFNQAALHPAPPAEMREFAFNELIGLEGPLLTLFENAATVILTIGCCPPPPA